MPCQLWAKIFADAHGDGGQLLGSPLRLDSYFGCISSWQYYHDLSGDFHRSGSCYFQCYFKSLGQKDQSKLAYHVTGGVEDYFTIKFPSEDFVHLRWARDDRTLGTERDVAESGGLYLSLVGGSIVLLGLLTSLGALIRATHNPRLPLMLVFYQCLEYSFSSLAIFVLDMG